VGTPLSAATIAMRYMEPALEAAGLRRLRFHDLRHTFSSLLIQAGVPLKYIQLQVGHSPIQVTADVSGHMGSGNNVNWIDTLDRTAPAKSANQAQTQMRRTRKCA
jgi:integrase